MSLQKKQRKKIDIVLIILFFAMAFIVRCANPAAPTGGPRDSLPPRIVEALPANLSKNFDSKRITITFNEYVQLKDVQKDVIIAPPMKRKPNISIKGRSVVVDFREPLDSATTYKIDFGNAIRDNNEGNIFHGYSYVFSTGNEIDSLAMSGQVLDAFKRDSVIGATILFYDAAGDTTQLDSMVFLGRPISIARTDSTGVFLATNLKGIDYRVFAIQDKNGNMAYEPGEDLIAVGDTLYNPLKMPPFKVWYNPLRMRVESSPQFKMLAYDEVSVRRQNLLEMKRLNKYTVRALFASRLPVIEELNIEGLSQDDIFRQSVSTGDTLTLYVNPKGEMPDSLRIRLKYYSTDSIGNDTLMTKKYALGFHEPKKNTRRNEVQLNPFRVVVNLNDDLNPTKNIDFTFGYPLKEMLSEHIILREEVKEDERKGVRRTAAASTKKEDMKMKVIPFSFTRDSSDIMKWSLKASWKPGTNYDILIPDSSFVNIAGEKNDTLKAPFKTMSPDKYAVIKYVLSGGRDSVNYIVQMINSRKEVVYQKEFAKNGAFEFNYVAPNSYTIRVIEDVNNNGKWDGGNVTKRIKPEAVVIYKDKNGAPILQTQENWEVDIPVHLDALFGYPKPVKPIEEKQTQTVENPAEKPLESSKEKTTEGSAGNAIKTSAKVAEQKEDAKISK